MNGSSGSPCFNVNWELGALHHLGGARLCAELESAFASSRLPETPSGADALNNLLLRIRFTQWGTSD